MRLFAPGYLVDRSAMIKKAIIAVAFLVAPIDALSECTLQWDYDFSYIEGFRLYQGDMIVGTIEPDKRDADCGTAGMVPGPGQITMTAYRGDVESDKSLPAVFDLTVPGLRVIISTP